MAADDGQPAFPPAWRLTGAEPITETFSSRIWKVTRDDGSLAVVKALKGLVANVLTADS